MVVGGRLEISSLTVPEPTSGRPASGWTSSPGDEALHAAESRIEHRSPRRMANRIATHVPRAEARSAGEITRLGGCPRRSPAPPVAVSGFFAPSLREAPEAPVARARGTGS